MAKENNSQINNPQMVANFRRKAKNILVLLFAAIIFLFVGIRGVEAATLYFSPSSGSHALGQNFSVGVYVSSADQAMNAVSGVVKFPQDKLKITSVSKTGSIITLWVQEPVFSNDAGTVNFEGIVSNPGFTGSAGKVITLNFSVKAAGAGPLSFSSGSVLANDGQGTNILTGLGSASFALGDVPLSAPESTVPSTVAGAPAAPQIFSDTHPDSNKWYPKSTASFKWDLPADVTAVRLLVGRLPQAIPTVTYSPPISSKEVKDLEDGVWYFHAQFKNDYGWGAITHYRFQIDTVPPAKFAIKAVDSEDSTNPKPVVLFNTTDSGSGIDYYKVKIGDKDFIVVSADEVESNPYTLPPSAPGKQTLLVQAFDRAGNYETALTEISIEALEAPVLTDYPRVIEPGQYLVVKGRTEPQSAVSVWLEQKGANPRLFAGTSDALGDFTVVGDGNIRAGVYEMWVEAVDSRGAKTLPTERVTIAVKSSNIIRIGSIAINFLTIIISVLTLLIAIVGIFWFVLRRLSD
ncbi:MAG TPA: cohesin domain-containing protein, partial [Candidatus Paceibacterota bacterium]|nr:cohesin domain-containing protein [Candidatus Paceibacterota bacterium]